MRIAKKKKKIFNSNRTRVNTVKMSLSRVHPVFIWFLRVMISRFVNDVIDLLCLEPVFGWKISVIKVKIILTFFFFFYPVPRSVVEYLCESMTSSIFLGIFPDEFWNRDGFIHEIFVRRSLNTENVMRIPTWQLKRYLMSRFETIKTLTNTVIAYY